MARTLNVFCFLFSLESRVSHVSSCNNSPGARVSHVSYVNLLMARVPHASCINFLGAGFLYVFYIKTLK